MATTFERQQPRAEFIQYTGDDAAFMAELENLPGGSYVAAFRQVPHSWEGSPTPVLLVFAADPGLDATGLPKRTAVTPGMWVTLPDPEGKGPLLIAGPDWQQVADDAGHNPPDEHSV